MVSTLLFYHNQTPFSTDIPHNIPPIFLAVLHKMVGCGFLRESTPFPNKGWQCSFPGGASPSPTKFERTSFPDGASHNP